MILYLMTCTLYTCIHACACGDGVSKLAVWRDSFSCARIGAMFVVPYAWPFEKEREGEIKHGKLVDCTVLFLHYYYYYFLGGGEGEGGGLLLIFLGIFFVDFNK